MTELAEPDQAPPATVVTMTIPARHEFVRLARLTAAALGNQAGFDVDEIEDLRIAVDELMCVLIDGTDGSPAVWVSFALTNGSVSVEGRAPVVREVGVPRLVREILGVVVDSYDVRADDGEGIFRCSKRSTA
jgi:hypothetical protein